MVPVSVTGTFDTFSESERESFILKELKE